MIGSSMTSARVLLVLLVLGAGGSVRAVDTDIDIRPGPTTISADEAAIQPDASKGVEHGVILVEETAQNDAYGNAAKLEFHLRAKILSNQGRDLANVRIWLDPDVTLENWWGRTLLPDGRVLTIRDDDVVIQPLFREGFTSLRVAKFALRGVVPGAVIDYGYTATRAAIYRWHQVPLQQDWPIRSFRYRWKTYGGYSSAYRIRHSEGLQVHVDTDQSSVLVVGRDLPPLPREDYMPPADDVRAALVLYYMDRSERYADFWSDYGKQIDKDSRVPSNEAVVRTVLAAAKRAGGTDPAATLKAAYDWIAANLPNPLYVRPDDGDRARLSVSASPLDPLDKLYFDVARALGADAHVVLAPNRNDHTWDKEVRSLDQLPTSMVAVRLSGGADASLLFVHLKPGLPFGEIPWWNTGVEALMASPEGYRSILVGPSGPASNVSRVTAEQTFSGDGSSVITRWRRTSGGQNGLTETERLGGLTGKDRQAQIADICGEGPDVEVTHAECATGYPPVSSRCSCETDRRNDAFDPAANRYMMSWGGPWVGPVPDLPPGTRTHPVVFDYPRVDLLDLTVKAPAGFHPMPPPDGVSLSGPYGKYRLAITVTGDGYKVERALALFPVVVPVAQYEALRSFLEDVRRADRTSLRFERPAPQP